MPKDRTHVPKAVREQVLKEFSHRCAMCGRDSPHVHHIDEDPSNHDPENLLPLCPSCHLGDQHNPTKAIERGRLVLFRRFKDPTVLGPQFEPLYRRCRFLEDIENPDLTYGDLGGQATELVEFVSELQMGGFYAKKLKELLRPPGRIRTFNPWGGSPAEAARNRHQDAVELREYREQLTENRPVAEALLVELCRFQPWGVDGKA